MNIFIEQVAQGP